MHEMELSSEMLVLPGGRVLVHNLTPEMARFLDELGLRDGRTGVVEDTAGGGAAGAIARVGPMCEGPSVEVRGRTTGSGL